MIEVIHGDCLELLEGAEAVHDLVFADPPFGIGQAYDGFTDKWESEQEYESWIRKWVERCARACRGVLCLHGPDNLAEIYLGIHRSSLATFGRMHRIAWVNWHYRFGQCSRRNWIDSPSDGPFWGRVQGTSKERWKGHPNQLPERYMERLIRAYTNVGDHVLDPFGGSGTTAVVCQALGRRCTTIDISHANCVSIRRRLERGAVRIACSGLGSDTKGRVRCSRVTTRFC